MHTAAEQNYAIVCVNFDYAVD